VASLPATTGSEISDADESVETMVAAFHEEREVGLTDSQAPYLVGLQPLTTCHWELLRDDDWTSSETLLTRAQLR
jgi:hypothetical protein